VGYFCADWGERMKHRFSFLVLVPLFLKGYNSIFVGLVAVAILTFVILLFVYGLDKRH